MCTFAFGGMSSIFNGHSNNTLLLAGTLGLMLTTLQVTQRKIQVFDKIKIKRISDDLNSTVIDTPPLCFVISQFLVVSKTGAVLSIQSKKINLLFFVVVVFVPYEFI